MAELKEYYVQFRDDDGTLVCGGCQCGFSPEEAFETFVENLKEVYPIVTDVSYQEKATITENKAPALKRKLSYKELSILSDCMLSVLNDSDRAINRLKGFGIHSEDAIGLVKEYRDLHSKLCEMMGEVEVDGDM